MLSARTQAIRDSLFAQPRQIDLERALLYTQSWKQTEGQSVLMRRALALRHILEQHEIVIDEYDLLAGNRTRTPRAGVLSPEMSPYWIVDELDKFPTRPQDTFEMSEADKLTFRDELLNYWSGTSLNDWYSTHISQQAADAQKTKIFSVAQTDKGQGHIIADIPTVLSRGFGALAADAHQKAEENPSNEFYAAAAVCLDATIAYIQRYEQVCRAMASTADEKRAAELLDMAGVLAQVATQPARDLRDALQLVWLTELVLEHESNASSISLGRMDQYLWPYYCVTVEAGVSAQDIRELIQ